MHKFTYTKHIYIPFFFIDFFFFFFFAYLEILCEIYIYIYILNCLKAQSYDFKSYFGSLKKMLLRVNSS